MATASPRVTGARRMKQQCIHLHVLVEPLARKPAHKARVLHGSASWSRIIEDWWSMVVSPICALRPSKDYLRDHILFTALQDAIIVILLFLFHRPLLRIRCPCPCLSKCTSRGQLIAGLISQWLLVVHAPRWLCRKTTHLAFPTSWFREALLPFHLNVQDMHSPLSKRIQYISFCICVRICSLASARLWRQPIATGLRTCGRGLLPQTFSPKYVVDGTRGAFCVRANGFMSEYRFEWLLPEWVYSLRWSCHWPSSAQRKRGGHLNANSPSYVHTVSCRWQQLPDSQKWKCESLPSTHVMTGQIAPRTSIVVTGHSIPDRLEWPLQKSV